MACPGAGSGGRLAIGGGGTSWPVLTAGANVASRGATSESGLPHCLQNLAAARSGAPQCGQALSSGGGLAAFTLTLEASGRGGKGTVAAEILCDGCAESVSLVSALPQRPQNLLPDCTSAPHFGQCSPGDIVWARATAAALMGAPHFPQNFFPAPTSA